LDLYHFAGQTKEEQTCKIIYLFKMKTTPRPVSLFSNFYGDGPQRMFMGELMLHDCIYCIKEK
jgi:hypothetical protein